MASQKPDGPVQAGERVSDFELTGGDGKTYSSSTLRQNGLVLAVLFKTGCGTCQYAFPYVQRFQEQYAEKSEGRFQVLGISQDDRETTLEFARKYGNASFPILLDSALKATAQYRITNVPNLYLLGADDTVQGAVVGSFSSEGFNDLARQVAAFLGATYVPIVRDEDNAPALKPG